MYRAGLEWILGFQVRGQQLKVDPCIPRWWREFEIVYRFGRSTYRIKVENPLALNRGVARVELDDKVRAQEEIVLVDDGQSHTVRILMGEKVTDGTLDQPAQKAKA
jgi:cyclic beta-1,2-glucan synthetase